MSNEKNNYSVDNFADSATTLLMQVPAAIAILEGPEHTYRMVNTLYEKYYSKTAAQLLGKKVKEVFPELEGQGIFELFGSIYSSGEVFQQTEFPASFYEQGILKSAYYDFSAKPLKDNSGKVYAIMLFVIDVTEKVAARKNAEDKQLQLTRLNDDLNLSAAAGKIGIWNYDAKTNVLHWSKEQLNIYGINETNFKKTPEHFHSFLFNISYEQLNELSEKNKIGEESSYEFQIKRADGELRWIHAKSKTITDAQNQIEFIHGVNIDITDQRAALTKIEQNKIELQELANAMPQVVWKADPEGKVIYYNDRVSEFSGTTKDEDGIWQWAGIVHEQDLKSTEEAWLSAVKNGKAYQQDHRIKMKDGSFRWHLSRGLPLKDDDGTIICWYGTATDIHDQRLLIHELQLAKDELERSKEELLTMANNIGQLAWMTDEKGWIYWYNQRWYDYTGTNLEQMQGWGWQKVHHPDSVDEVSEKYQRALDEGTAWEDTFRLKGKDGEYRWFLSRAYPVRKKDGRLKGWFGTNTDVTELRKAQEDIRNSESKLRTLAETLPQLIWVTDQKGEQQYVSPRWKEYTGIEPTGSETWIHIIHSDDLESIGQAWSNSLKSGDMYKIELRLKNKNGSYRWFFGTAEAVKNDNDEIVNWIGSFTDIHEQKQFAQQLELLVKERTTELESKNKELKLINREMESFNHIASHDLQEPLRKIQSFLNLLELKINDENARHKYIEKIHSSASRMSSLIRSILDYNSLASYERKKLPVDLDKVVKDVLTDFELRVEEKNAKIVCNDLGLMSGIPHQIHQLFSNLLSNSLKFATRDPQINISSHTNAQGITITFSDNGIGFSEEYKEKIFDLFQRLHNQSEYPGTGIGLGIVKKVVDNHDGSIEVQSTPGVGTVFRIFFPNQ